MSDGPELPPAPTTRIPVDHEVSLAASLYRAPNSPAPAIVLFTPYRRETIWNLQYVEIARAVACHFIAIDVRGIGGSGGEWDGPYSPQEISDCARALAWIAEQDFCDGQTAMIGASYSGGNQYLIAARRPRGLRCGVAQIAPTDFYRDLWHRGGMPSHANWGAVTGQLTQQRPGTMSRLTADFYGPTLSDPFDGDRARSRSGEQVLDEIEIPMLVTGGWYDYFLRGTVRAFKRLRSPKRLLVGNWCHEDEVPDAEKEEVERWFAFWLRGEGDDPTTGKNVRLQCVGTDTWDSYESWPEPSKVLWERWTPLAEPTQVRVPTVIIDVLPTTGSHLSPFYDLLTGSGMRLWGEAWHAESVPVERTRRLRGPVALSAVLSSNEASDLDLHARLSVVRRDGAIHQVTEGRLRASHRALDRDRNELTSQGEISVPWHPHEQSEPLPLGEPVTLEVEIFPINIELAPGDRLRIGITLVRADDVAEPTHATLLPETRVLLPARPVDVSRRGAAESVGRR